MAVLGLHCCVGSSLVARSSGFRLVVVHGLFIAVASLFAETGSQTSVVAACELSSCGTWA